MTSQEYAKLIQRIQAVVGQNVQPGSRVLVVNRGDHQLLKLGHREGWHFPQDDSGAWTGYHPETAREAIDLLEAGRKRGADYILFPATALWWLDHYGELGDHLSANYRLVHDEPGVCRIYGLTGGDAVGARPSRPDSTAPARLPVRLPRFLDALLPERAGVALVAAGTDAGQELRGRPSCRAGTSSSRIPGVIAELDELRGQGWEFAAVLAPSHRPDARTTQLARAVGRSYRRVAHRTGIGWLFDLTVQEGVSRGQA